VIDMSLAEKWFDQKIATLEIAQPTKLSEELRQKRVIGRRRFVCANGIIHPSVIIESAGIFA
jgi:hypothetical protein